MQELYNACIKYPDLETYLKNYIKNHNKFYYDDSAGSFECIITILQNEENTNKYVLDINIYPTCGGITNTSRNEKQFYNTLCELFENEYVSVAFGYVGFLKNYNGYKKYPEVFKDLLIEGKISDNS
jgi:hypothetical protein